MNKSIIIFCAVIATLSLTAFGYINAVHPPNDINFVYEVNSRYINTVTKSKLDDAQSIIDILPEKATRSIQSFKNVKISIIDTETETSAKGEDDVLNTFQLMLLQSTDYTSNILIDADFKKKNLDTGKVEDGNLTYYMTIIPEKEAAFSGGQDALMEYLKENSKQEIEIVKKDKLQPGKVSFTITKNGAIKNVALTSTSGYSSVDKAMVELISTVPGKWDPAKNIKGEKVDQKLVFFFGLIGC